jgi:hypothetical protein
MRVWQILVPLAAVALGSTVFALSWRRSSVPRRSPPEDVGKQVAELRRRLAELEARPNGDRVVVVQQPSELAARAEAAEKDAPAREPEDDRPLAEKVAAAADALEVRFLGEPPDPAFTREATQSARYGVEVGGGSRVASVDCVRSMCKVVTTHDTSEEQMTIASKVEMVPFFQPGTYFSYERSALPLKTTLYVIRPGHSFRN